MSAVQGPAAPTLAEAQLALGQMELDRGAPAAALEWFRAAARSGDPQAFNMLGRCHERGWGIAADPARAAHYYRRAVDLGDGWAMFNLADLHLRGIGVPQSDEAAHGLYVRAARKGNSKALTMLGLLYEDGRISGPTLRDVAALYEAAAEGGDGWGALNLARLLLGGGDVASACLWLERALAHGFGDLFRAMAELLRDQPDPRIRALAEQAARRGQLEARCA